MLAGLVAAGAALAVAGSSFMVAGSSLAASGPGNDGAAITSKQANDLLKAGDDFTTNESPQRFGGERLPEGSLLKPDKLALQAGGGPIEGLQAGADKTIETAKKNVEEAGSRLGDLFKGNNNAGDLSTSSIEDAANNVRGGIEDLVNNGPSKVKSDVETTGDKVKSDIASTQGVTRQASNKAGNVADQVQDKASDAVEGGKDFLSNLKDKITVSHHSPVTFRAHMESLLKDNVNMKFGERSRHL
ncbi:hypothetical protein AXG93_406s1480 [Marchantia polymorpha subsp. ruderalis]|uniref:Uncharacterized protein n=1 Tax=Marchantia polymorpha subsp. ruderalis TaxID=1480154 RepID=A0A176VBA5_MARPO|nr:hypothetical protein AXG93_406s1480 [Marchantia polymorpha subsp. ruderalis]